MHIKTAFALALLAWVSCSTTSNATAYYDEASWQAATAGMSAAPYSGVATQTDFYKTIVVSTPNPFCAFFVCVVGSSTTTHPTNFNSWSGNFTFASPCAGEPDCFITSEYESTITFSQPIMGFAARAGGAYSEASVIIDGDFYSLPDSPFPGNFFFGWVGPISSLTLYGDGFTDNLERVGLNDIVVPTPEPTTLTLFGAGLVGAAAMRRRRRVAMPITKQH